jgi:prepilin-type N-terminal cleavage/methylation domain-containing protein
MYKCTGKTADSGFTLLECLLAVLLVGLAVAALVAANSSFTRVNGAAAELSTAEFLIEQIRERTDPVAYDDLDGFDNAVFNPPITADGQALSDFRAYTQTVTVQNINASNFEQSVADSNFIKVTTRVLLNGKEIDSASWIRANY